VYVQSIQACQVNVKSFEFNIVPDENLPTSCQQYVDSCRPKRIMPGSVKQPRIPFKDDRQTAN